MANSTVSFRAPPDPFMTTSRWLWPTLLLAACKPPATDEYVERVELVDRGDFASEPLPSPDTEGAVWAGGVGDMRLIYGRPGETPTMALACDTTTDEPLIRFTRYAPADPGAGALVAFLGNNRAARLPIDAIDNGRGWLWEGTHPARSNRMDVFTGDDEVTATVPGAGKLVLNPSEKPGALVKTCRQMLLNEQPTAKPGRSDPPT